MKKKYVLTALLILAIISCLFAFAACNKQLSEEEAWEAYENALAASKEYINSRNYFIKYKYKDGDMTITQKLNVSYGNDNIDGWEDFVVVNKGVEKASKITTTYVNSYYGYSLKSGVKHKKETKEDYKVGYINNDGDFYEDSDIDSLFGLKSGDSYNGSVFGADEDIEKYTMGYVLGTLDGIGRDSVKLISANKNGAIITLSFLVEAEGLYYSGYNTDGNCLTVRITADRITKICSSDENAPAYFINYAGPKFSLPSYDAKSQ